MTTNESEFVLTVRNLRVGYGGRRASSDAVRGVDLDIRRSEIVALVGESGSGKSTTAMSIVGLLDAGAVRRQDEITFDGRRIDGYTRKRMRTIRGSGIGLVPQDPTVSLDPVQTIGSQVVEVLREHRLVPRSLYRSRVVELLEEVGLDQPELRMGQYPHQLSGGMRQRVLIAIALAAQPQLLIADEPTSALDVTVQKKILDRIEDLSSKAGIAVLLITHDLGVAADRADRIVVMKDGLIIESGTTKEVLTNPTTDYTRMLLAATPASTARGRTFGASAPAAREADGEQAPPLLTASSLTKQFRVHSPAGRRSVTAVDDVSFTVYRGRTVALVGESGSGKSTTARLIAGIDQPTSGEVLLEGAPILGRRADLRTIRRRISFVYQNPYASVNPAFSLEEIVTEPALVHQSLPRRRRRELAVELLDSVALPSSFVTRRPGELSGGQRQRVAIARALCVRPELLVLDEPVSALDVSVQAKILDLLYSLQREHHLAYVFISHDLSVVRSIADEVHVMRRGKIVESGSASVLFDNPHDPYTVELLAAVPGSRLPAAESR